MSKPAGPLRRPGRNRGSTEGQDAGGLAPRLVERVDTGDPTVVEQWLATFEAPPRREVTRSEITADGDVAFATSIDAMTATPQGRSEPYTLWYRVTLGLRRVDGRWLVTH